MATIDSFSNSTSNSSYEVYGVMDVAETFTVSSIGYNISSATFYLFKSGSPTGNYYFKIATVSGTPGTTAVPYTLLATSSAGNIASITATTRATAQTVTLNFSNLYLAPGNYAVTVSYSGGSSGTSLSVNMTNSSSDSTRNSAQYYSGSFHADTVDDLAFIVTGTPYTDKTQTGYATLVEATDREQTAYSTIMNESYQLGSASGGGGWGTFSFGAQYGAENQLIGEIITWRNITALADIKTTTDKTTTGYASITSVGPARTNYVQYSQSLSNWTSNGGSVSDNIGVAPDGTTTASLISTNSSYQGRYRIPTISFIPNGDTLTYSIYLKYVSGGYSWLIGTDTSRGGRITVNLLSNTITNVEGTVLSSSVTSCGNSWYRISVTFKALAASVPITVYGINGSTASSAYAWGGQVEISDHVTNYIPTATTAVTVYGYSQTGYSDIKTTADKTIGGYALIDGVRNQTITGYADILLTTDRAIDGYAKIIWLFDRTQTGYSDILVTVNRTQDGYASIINTVDKDISGYAFILALSQRTISGRAYIYNGTEYPGDFDINEGAYIKDEYKNNGALSEESTDDGGTYIKSNKQLGEYEESSIDNNGFYG